MKIRVLRSCLSIVPSGSSNAKDIDDLRPVISVGGLIQRGCCVMVRFLTIGLRERESERSLSGKISLVGVLRVRTDARISFDHGVSWVIG